MPAAEQDQVVDRSRATVGEGAEVVHIAERWGAAAALGGAAAVPGGDGAALRAGDGVGERFEADDPAVRVDGQPAGARIALQGFDQRSGRWAGPGTGRAVRAGVPVEVER